LTVDSQQSVSAVAAIDDAIARLGPLEARTLTSTTTELLREKILDGSLRPGTRLIESDIARQLRISRGPVREALATLRAERLVHDESPRGVSVAALSAQDIREIYEVRASLESGAARLVITGGDASATDRLAAALDRMRAAAGRGSQLEFVEADLALHEQLCRVSGNERLLQAWETQVGLLRTLIRLETAAGGSSFGPLLEDHERFVIRIVHGDVSGAADECWQLFRRSNALLSGAALRQPSRGSTQAGSTIDGSFGAPQPNQGETNG
jgi:DNA-binding GntR family transcriptional regulator